jgi:copper chaperone CopZ
MAGSEQKTVAVPNISCGHCVMTIQRELGELPGVESVQADASTKRVTVAWRAPADWSKIAATLDDIGYPVQS